MLVKMYFCHNHQILHYLSGPYADFQKGGVQGYESAQSAPSIGGTGGGGGGGGYVPRKIFQFLESLVQSEAKYVMDFILTTFLSGNPFAKEGPDVF